MTKKERQQVKNVARDLLETLKTEKLVLDWRKKQQSRAAVRLVIGEILDEFPPCYTTTLYRKKCDLIYQHIYDCYLGQGQSVYAPTA